MTRSLPEIDFPTPVPITTNMGLSCFMITACPRQICLPMPAGCRPSATSSTVGPAPPPQTMDACAWLHARGRPDTSMQTLKPMLRTTYLSKLLPTANDGIVALHQLTGVNHVRNMRPMPGLQIPRVVAATLPSSQLRDPTSKTWKPDKIALI